MGSAFDACIMGFHESGEGGPVLGPMVALFLITLIMDQVRWCMYVCIALSHTRSPFAPLFAAPRLVWLDDSGRQLIQWPIKELESLRRKQVGFSGIELKAGSLFQVKGIKASQADVEVEFELPSLEGAELLDPAWMLDPQRLCGEKGVSIQGVVGPFGLMVLASHNLKEHTAVFFRVFKGNDNQYIVLMCSDQRSSSFRAEVNKPTFGGFVDVDLRKEAKISLKTLIDHSVIESFGGGGRTCITARIYPALLLTGSGRLYAFNNGTETVRISELKAWSMARARMNDRNI